MDDLQYASVECVAVKGWNQSVWNHKTEIKENNLNENKQNRN